MAYNGKVHVKIIAMDNTVGSLTQCQYSVIIGSILGDGYLRKFIGRKDALLEINHSYKQREYVEWKYLILKDISASPPKLRKSGKNRLAIRFYTKQLPIFTDLMSKFYKNKKKVIPDELKLNPDILAVWYMDDGSRCGKSNFYLNTQQYSLKDQKKLIKKLKTLGLEVVLNKDKHYWRLRFLGRSISKLKLLIQDKIIPSMQYKLG